jgi:hypothetical protein
VALTNPTPPRPFRRLSDVTAPLVENLKDETMSEANREAEFQLFADARVAPEYRQPLKTIDEALAANGWPVEDRPSCCGQPVSIQGFLGCADLAECETCGKFVARANAPQFGNSWVDLPTIEEPKSGRVWIAGTRAKATAQEPGR